MKTSEAKTLMNSESEHLTLGVKIGQITAEQAAAKIMKSNSEACRVAELVR